MKNVIYSTHFKKDMKTIEKRGYKLIKMFKTLEMLRNSIPLPISMKQHQLKGNYTGYLECHIEPDWLLIYKIFDLEILLYRTGTHSDLF